MKQTHELEAIASQVRRDIVRMVTAVNSGHPGGSLGAADLLVTLFFDILEADPARFTKEGRGEDLFYLSNGHISPVLYSVLAHRGYFPVAELDTFRKIGSRLQGHPSPAKGLPGVRVASGSLGQGLSCGIGHALAKRLDGDPHKVFVLMGDGELEEGQIWEAALFAHARKVDNLIGMVDLNGQQIDGSCAEVMALDNLRGKWEAFGWTVEEVDGHDIDALRAALLRCKNELCGHGKPVVLLVHTIMGKGVDFMEGTNEFHGKAPTPQQAEHALTQLKETLGDY